MSDMNQVIPAHLLRLQSRNLAGASLQGLGSAAPPRVSIRQNRFSLLDSAGNATPVNTFHLDVVVVDVNPNVSKIYFDEAYDPQASEHAAPACWSDNGEGPSAQAAKPQNDRCASCPHNQWGSDVSRVTGKGTKACNDFKKLAVLVPGYADTPFVFHVPPASLKHLRAYGQTLMSSSVGSRSVDMSDVITRLSFDPTVQGVINFAPVGWIDEAMATRLDALAATPEVTAKLVGLDDQVAVMRPAVGQAPLAPRLAAPQGIPPASAAVVTTLAPPPTTVAADVSPAGPKTRKKAAPPPAAAAPAPTNGDAIPDFLKRSAAPAMPPPPPASFGMAAAQAPDAALQAQIANVFSLPTGKANG